MKPQDLIHFIEYSGKDPSRLIFEDELTGLYNRRFLLHYFQSKVDWADLDGHPISLLLMDLDHFKQVNDTMGHDAGDRALIWLAGHLRHVAGDAGLPIRYAGDEFMMLFRDVGKQAAMARGRQLIERVHAHPFQLPENPDIASLTLSIGVASAPENGRRGADLIKWADLALYSAKNAGRDQQVDASDVKPERVFAKTAAYRLDQVKIVGRNEQLHRIGQFLDRFGRKQNQFLLVVGEAGAGKTEFLETVRRNLVNKKGRCILVGGDVRESYRPYYLITRILLALLAQRTDKGVAAFECLSPSERAFVGEVLPHIRSETGLPADMDGKQRREGIFLALAGLFQEALEGHPLHLLIDDMHFGDEATLLLLRHVFLRQEVPLFVCGSTPAFGDQQRRGRSATPLQRFCENHQPELRFQALTLTPLRRDDIGTHIRSVFPDVQLPDQFVENLAAITRGNPLFLNQTLRQLVLDNKIELTGNGWCVNPLEKSDFPGSLDDIVRRQMDALDDESRQLVQQLSAHGQDVPISILTGSTAMAEGRMLESLERARDRGLLHSRFQLNDEIVRFQGQPARDAAYQTLDPTRRQQLHERIASYQENLYHHHLLSSPASLVYHYERSSLPQKAATYQTLQTALDHRNYSPPEAVLYAVEGGEEFEIAGRALEAEDVVTISELLRGVITSVRNVRLYPSGSKSIVSSIDKLKATLERFFINNETMDVILYRQVFLINGAKVDVSEFRLIADEFRKLLNRLELRGLTLRRGLSKRELNVVIQAFAKPLRKTFPTGFWEHYATQNKLIHTDLKQVRYAMKVRAGALPSGGRELAGSRYRLSSETLDESAYLSLSQIEHQMLPDLLRALLSAATAAKLYPAKSKSVRNTTAWLMEKLEAFFACQRLLTISRAGRRLLINGERPTSGERGEDENVCRSVLDFLHLLGLDSLTILSGVTILELKAFLGSVCHSTSEPGAIRNWNRFSQENGLSHILFNCQLYEVQIAHAADDVTIPGRAGTPDVRAEFGLSNEPLTLEAFDALLTSLQQDVPQWMREVKPARAEQSVRTLFNGLADREFGDRQKAIACCRRILDDLPPAEGLDFGKILTAPYLLGAFEMETEPRQLVQMAALLGRLVLRFIQFHDYRRASHVLNCLRSKYDSYKEAKDSVAQLMLQSLKIRLEPAAQDLLAADLASTDYSRQRDAAALLDSLGADAMPVLLRVIKMEDDCHARQLAVSLLKELGPGVVNHLKRLMILEISPEERIRIIDVMDMLTEDLKHELTHAIGDPNPLVRQAAYRLAQRLGSERVVGWLTSIAGGNNRDLSISAIKCLQLMDGTHVEQSLIELLRSSKEEPLRLACCRALGQLGRPTSIQPLSTLLAPKRFWIFQRRPNSRLRAVAAFALGQIAHPKALDVLARLVDDPDPRVRETAQRALNDH